MDVASNVDLLLKSISTVGFPIVIAWYALTELKRQQEKTQEILSSLRETLAQMLIVLGERQKTQ